MSCSPQRRMETPHENELIAIETQQQFYKITLQKNLNPTVSKEQVLFSTYYLPGTLSSLKKIRENCGENSCILSVGYPAGDTQLGLTGTKKTTDSNIAQTAIREFQEETGLTCTENNLHSDNIVRNGVRFNQKVSVFAVNVNDCDPIGGQNVNGGDDVRTVKCVMICHGTEDEMLTKCRNTLLKSNNTDAISHFFLIPIDTAIACAQILIKAYNLQEEASPTQSQIQSSNRSHIQSSNRSHIQSSNRSRSRRSRSRSRRSRRSRSRSRRSRSRSRSRSQS